MKRVFLYFLLSISLLSAETAVPALQNEQTQAQTQPEQIPSSFAEELKNGEEGDSRFFQEFLSMLFSVGIILGAIFVLMWVLRRMMNARMEQVNLKSSIKIIERRPLSPKTTIYILEIHGKAVTIADSHNGVALLSQSPLPSEDV
jgi:flagellar biogenesis protein FliO